MPDDPKTGLTEVLMLPVLLLVAFAAWTATFLSANHSPRR